MRQTDRNPDRELPGNETVSPYLLLPLRSYATVIRERESRTGKATSGSGQAVPKKLPRRREGNADRGDQ